MNRREPNNEHLPRVLVVGEFCVGKSTLINALLGRKILPAANEPTTAVVTKITYSDSF